MVRQVNVDASERSVTVDVAGVEALPDLAAVLRALRRRHARQQHRGELTYRELATRTGWSVGAVAEYLTGRTLPPTDRFDVLVGLLGATPAEQGLLATARDRVAEGCRRPRQPARGSAPAPVPVPRQLPADVFAFTGRASQLAYLDALLAGPAGVPPTAVVISAVSGTAGVGKTALAVHWAHHVAAQFPDGQLFVNLRGYDPEQPVSPADALTRLLTALGVAGGDIPLDLEERAARYRSQLAGRRMLIVLDNAAAVEQIRPLLPGTPSCAVVVTSRDSLAGLVARDGARRLDLDLLPLLDAVALLSHLIGPRAEAEPQAVATLANLCVRLPLALRIVAELAVARPAVGMAELAAELADRQERLHLLDAGGDPRAAVGAVFSWSLQQLPPAVARTFRLLGLHPGADLDGYAVAALADVDLATARHHIDALARAHLVDLAAPGRYTTHDLLRAYAVHSGQRCDTGGDRRDAQQRLFDFYLATASTAMDLLHPADVHYRPRTPRPATPAPQLADAPAARTWLDTERPNLVAIATHTATGGWPAYAVDLSTMLYRYLDGGHYTDALAVHTHAHRAAERTGNQTGQAHALLGIGVTHLHLGQYQQGTDHLRRALALFRQSGDHTGQTRVLGNLANIERRLGRYDSATTFIRQALALARHAGDPVGQLHGLLGLATVELRRGHPEAAVDHLQQALAVARQTGNRLSEANALNGIGLAEQQLNREQAGIDHLQQALAVYREVGHRQGEADVLDSLGSILAGLGQPHKATPLLIQALSLFRAIGDRGGQACALNGLGEAAHAAGRLAEALTQHNAALAIATEICIPDQQARAHTGLGHAHRALGELDRARHHYQRALSNGADAPPGQADQIRLLLAVLPAPAGE